MSDTQSAHKQHISHSIITTIGHSIQTDCRDESLSPPMTDSSLFRTFLATNGTKESLDWRLLAMPVMGVEVVLVLDVVDVVEVMAIIAKSIT